ncbi:MAG TPA: hypothetical protein PLV87_04185, partial [Opitutaceae bacterium]|nr:hypothetical protein [Opitutaceae bacterium]
PDRTLEEIQLLDVARTSDYNTALADSCFLFSSTSPTHLEPVAKSGSLALADRLVTRLLPSRSGYYL